jgi:hypothetical protein
VPSARHRPHSHAAIQILDGRIQVGRRIDQMVDDILQRRLAYR